jgi:hypothetical protein
MNSWPLDRQSVLVKGGKWIYGWVVVSPEREVVIPPDAWREFGFQGGGEAVFAPGSRRSSGFAVSTPGLMAKVSERLEGATLRVLGQGCFSEDGKVLLPPEVDVQPGDRLLAVRDSRYGLGFAVQGPIYEEALKHPDKLQVFGGETEWYFEA